MTSAERAMRGRVLRSRRWLALPALLLGAVALSCALSVFLVQARVVEPLAGKLDLGAFSVVMGDELQLCSDRRTVCATFYRVDLVVPWADRASGQRTLLRVPLSAER